jgi:ABC-2 type transport system permease protein
LNGAWAVFYRELMFYRRRGVRTVLSAIIHPALFLLAFGYGIGRGATVNGMSYLSFLLPGLITMSSMNQSYGISLEVHISRYYFKVFEEYLLAPIARWEIVAGEVLYGVCKGMIPVLFLLGYSAVAGIGLRITPLFLFCLALHLLAFSLLGFIVAMAVESHADQSAFSTFVMVPMIFLSDTFYPIDKMPLLAKYLGYLFPLTYSTKLIRGTLLPVSGLFSVKYLVFMVAITVVLVVGALVMVERAEA